MSGEQYSIFIKVDATQVSVAAKSLDSLGNASDKAEVSIKRFGNATKVQGEHSSKLAYSLARLAQESKTLSGAMDAAADSTKKAAGALDSVSTNSRQAAGAFESFNKIAKSVHSTFVLFIGIELARFLREQTMNVGKAADAYTNMKSQLDLATNSQDELNKAFKESTVIANKYYANVTDIATAYAKFNPIIVSMGRSTSDTTKVVSALSASLAISGRNAVDTSETYRQFSQAISGPNIQMEEMNTIIDSNQALWRGLQRQLPDVIAKYGSLKEAISKNAVTSKMLLDATIALGPEFEELAARKVPTMSNALTVLKNNFIEYIGEADKASGASTELATLILDLAEAFKGSANDANNLGVFVGVLTQAFAGGKGIISEYVDVINQLSDAYLTLTGRQAQAGANDPEIARLMQLGQGNVPVAELAQGKPTTAPKINPPVSKVDSKAAAKEAKDALEAFKAQIAAQVSAAENAEKIFSAQADSRKKRYELEADQIKGIAELQIRATKSEAMRISIAEEAQTKIIDAINQETNLRQESLAKEMEVTQAKLAGVQQELDMADAHKLKLADRLELTTKQSELETELAVKRQEQVQIELDAIGQIQSAERDLAEARQQAEETMVKEEALRQLEIMSSNLEYAKEMATGLAEAFGEVGSAIGGMSVAMAEYDKQSATIEIARKEAVDKAEGDQKRITEINDDAAKKQSKAEIKKYGDMTKAAQGFFKKGTAGYEAMGVATKAFRALEIAQQAMSFAEQMDKMGGLYDAFKESLVQLGILSQTETAKQIAQSQQKQVQNALEGASKQGTEGDPYTAFARVAAWIALMAGLGIAVGGGGGGGGASAPPPPETGTGTVFGDPTAVSESIGNSIKIIEENSSNDLNYSADMLDALYQIRDALGGVGELVAAKISPAIASLTSKYGTEALKQAGFIFKDQRLDKILASGRYEAYIGARIETSSGAAMLPGVEIKRGQTLVAKAGKEFEEAFGSIFAAIKTSIVEAGKVIGVTGDEITKRLTGLKIKGQIVDLAGLNAEESAKKLEAAFSAMSDTMAERALPEFLAFRKAGEGYKETITRVAEGINRAKGSLELLGMTAIDYTEITDKQGDVAAEITRQTIMAQGDLSEGTRKYVEQLQGGAADIIDSYKQILNITNLMRGAGFGAEDLDRTMINAAGGLSAFEESLQSFRDNFMTDAQRLSADTELLTKEFGKLGFALPKSKDEFYALALGIDKSTEDGKKLFARVITLSQAFSDLSDKTKDATDATAELMASLESGVKNAAQDLLKAFQSELAALETAKQQWIQAYKALNSALQAEVKSLIDNYKAIRTNLLSAKNVLKEAYGQEAASMQAVIDKTKSLSISLRTFIKSLSATSSNISPEQRYLSSRATFEDAVTRALSGDAAAKDELQSIASDFLESSKQYNASSEAYLRDYEAVVSTLNKVADQADEQVSLAEQQLNALKKQVEQYVVLTDATISVKDAVKQVELAQFAETEASKILNDTLVANGLMTEEQLSSLRESGDINASSTQQKLDEMKAASEAVVAAQNALSKFSEQIHAVLVENGWMTEQEFNDLINGGNGTGAINDGINNLGLATERVIEAQQTVAKSIDLLANEFGGLKETQKATAEAIVGALNNVGTQISASVGQAFDAYKMAIAELTKQQTAAAPTPAPTPEPVSAPVTAPTPVDNTSQRLQAAQSYSDRLNAELKIVNANTNNAIAAYNAGYQNAAVDFYEKAQQHQKAITAIKKEIESSGLNLKWARSGAGFSVTPYANGGMANPGLALVGENGPELVSFGSRGHVSTTSQTQGFFTNLQNAIEKGDAEQTNELQALVRLQSAANQQLIKEMKELKGEMAELARKAKLEAAA